MSTSVNSQSGIEISYFNIWLGILILFAVSITTAQLVHYRPIVLVTAFGIAMVQAILVGAYFMHLKLEKKYIHYLLYLMLVALALLYMGMFTDDGKPAGQHWIASDTVRIIQEHEHPESPAAGQPDHP